MSTFPVFPTHPRRDPELLSVSLRTPSLFLLPAGSIPSILYTFGGSATRRSALLTDILALSFSHNALSLLKLDSFKTGCVLLSGLFLYDIWWVFGTEVVSNKLFSPCAHVNVGCIPPDGQGCNEP